MSESHVVTTLQMKVRQLNASAIKEFAALLTAHQVRDSAPVEVRVHTGQRDQIEAVTLTATVVH